MKQLGIFLLFIGLIAASAAFVWDTSKEPKDVLDTTERSFVVPNGAGVKQVADKLATEGIVRNAFLFSLFAQRNGLAQSLHPGTFLLAPSMNATQIIKALSTNSLDVWITIPEGKRAEEIAEMLEKQVKTYDSSWKAALVEQEGYLFPDTYSFPREATIETVLSIFKTNFDKQYADIHNTTKYSQKDIVIIASLIEREANKDTDRPLVSSVIHNRLNINMALQVDATVQYIFGKSPHWWQPVSVANLRYDSPYNTYKYPGLPPGPICNPGKKALEAAANPAKSNYFYYITDKNGVTRFAETLDDHNDNINTHGL